MYRIFATMTAICALLSATTAANCQEPATGEKDAISTIKKWNAKIKVDKRAPACP
jgi:hypothetical protein